MPSGFILTISPGKNLAQSLGFADTLSPTLNSSLELDLTDVFLGSKSVVKLEFAPGSDVFAAVGRGGGDRGCGDFFAAACLLCFLLFSAPRRLFA